MRENKRRKVLKPVRYRDSPQNGDSNPSKQTVKDNHKSKDLRSKLIKQRKRRTECVGKTTEETDQYNQDMDESNLCPDYESDSNDSVGVIHTSDLSTDKSDQESDKEKNKDRNNNANKVKSVVVATTSKEKSRNLKEVRQRITFSEQSEAEEGEISSSDNPVNIDSFMEEADDDQLAQFLQKHRDRIQRVAEKTPRQESAVAGDENFLTHVIKKMSRLGKQTDQPVHNSQSEDTIYSRLVKQRKEYENSLQSANSCQNTSAGNHDQIDHDKSGCVDQPEPQQINTSND